MYMYIGDGAIFLKIKIIKVSISFSLYIKNNSKLTSKKYPYAKKKKF